jgi:hypothetical protein
VVISRSTPDRPGSDVIASFPAKPTVSVELRLPDPTSPETLLVRSVNARAVRASVVQWLVSEPVAAGTQNRTLTERQFRLWAC